MDTPRPRSDSPNPPDPDVFTRMANKRDQMRRQEWKEREKVDDLWEKSLKTSFTKQMLDYYKQEIIRRVERSNSTVIERKIQKCNQGNIDQVIDELNLTKIPDEFIKIPEESIKYLENINIRKRGEFEDYIKLRVHHLWQQHWDNQQAIRQLIPLVLDQCKNNAEVIERQQRIGGAIARGFQELDDRMQQLVKFAMSLRVRDR